MTATQDGGSGRLIGTTFSHGRDEVERLALRTAARLRDRGVRSGDRVMLKAENSVETVAAFLALLHLDTSVSLLDNQLTAADVERGARLTGARWLLGQREETAGEEVVCLRLADLVQGAPDAARAEDVQTGERLDFEAWSRRADALITWSSGSTGDPKAVVRRGRALFDNLSATADRMGYRSDDVLLPLLPFTHFYGLTLLMLWWRLGCSLALTTAGRLDRALHVAREAGVTVVDATPATYHSILRVTGRHPELREGLAGVRMWCVGGAPLSETLADDFRAAFGLPLLDGYGSSEAGNIALAPSDGAVGCGRPLDGVQVSVVDPDGAAVPAGGIGRILVRTPALMEGYLLADGTVAGAEEPFYATGDLGYLDAAGHLFVVGRANAVHRFGHTLYPSAIEARAQACGAPVKVLAFDDARRGAQLVFVVADPDGGTPRRWQEAINALLPGYEQPNRVLVVDEFPLKSTGKPDLAGLRQFALARLAEEPAGPAADPAAHPVSDPAEPQATALDGDGDGIPFPERVAALRRTLDFLREQPDAVLQVLTSMATHRSVELELEAALATLDGALAEVTGNRPQAVERMAVFMPSNVLLYSYVMYALVPSLYVRDVTLRPSSKVAAQTRRLHELLAPVHGLPIELSDLSQRKFVEGPCALAGLLVFTGTYANAERVRAALGREQVFVFFGQGVNPFVLGPDADVELAVEDAIRIRLHNSGQDCFAPDVLLVPRELRDSFVAGLCKRLSELRFGENADPDADYGPLYYQDALADSVEYLQRNRHAIVHGGTADFRTGRLDPTVFVRDLADGPAISEFFSPMFNVVGYPDRETLRRELGSPFMSERAMGAMAYGLDEELRELLAGKHSVAVDRTLLDIDDGNRPFGGRGMMANYVSFNGTRTAEPLLLSKVVSDYFGRGE
ncbi:aldehyde dehydrogenase family protein [Kitasatospora sp. NPDC048239]|uniref:aldehyde dehydrogenase family protein n=1 Tax=Kitasatospora sp. NPDC048239 TaxID=3364046 RepID=UPI003716D067